MRSAELLLHPVRLRLVQQFLGETGLTTGDLRSRLPEVSVATIYRHVAVLVDHDVLEVVGQRPVRGAVEKTYALRGDRASVDPDDMARMSPGEHLAAFAGFVAALLADFERYVNGGDVDLVRDAVGYRQVGFHASDEELADIVAGINKVVRPWLDAQPAEHRRRRLLSTVLLPSPSGPPSAQSPARRADEAHGGSGSMTSPT